MRPSKARTRKHGDFESTFTFPKSWEKGGVTIDVEGLWPLLWIGFRVYGLWSCNAGFVCAVGRLCDPEGAWKVQEVLCGFVLGDPQPLTPEGACSRKIGTNINFGNCPYTIRFRASGKPS